MKNTERLVWVDLLKVVSIFLVVLLHTSAVGVYQSVTAHGWWAANFYDSLSRVSVPLFVMVSGALLLGKQENYKDFFGKRVRRVLVPWLVWTFVYMIWAVWFRHQPVANFRDSKKLFIDTFLGGFWFLVMLFQLYILTPLLRILLPHLRKWDQSYFLILWFTVVSLLPLLEHFTQLKWSIPLPIGLMYLGYFVLGHFSMNIKWSRKQVFFAAAIFTGSFLFTLFATFFSSLAHGSFDEFFYGFLTPNVIALSLTSFVLLQKIAEQTSIQKMHKLLHWLSKTVFGVYLVHVIILEILGSGWLGFRLFGFGWQPFIAIPLTTIIVFIISTVIIFLLQKIPYIKMAVG